MKIEILPYSQTLGKNQAHWSRLDGKRVLWLGCYKCGEMGLLSDHKITEHEDGTITVEPSIVCPNEKCDAHYFIRKSEINE